MTVVTDKKLSDTRNLLLPGLWAENGKHPNLELKIDIDQNTRSLLITGKNKNNDRELGFAITEGQIADNLYKVAFRPAVLKLVELLNQPPLLLDAEIKFQDPATAEILSATEPSA